MRYPTLFVIVFLHRPIYYPRTTLALLPSSNSDPGSHRRRSSPLPTTARAVIFIARRIHSAFSSLVGSRRRVPTHAATRSQLLLLYGDTGTIFRREQCIPGGEGKTPVTTALLQKVDEGKILCELSWKLKSDYKKNMVNTHDVAAKLRPSCISCTRYDTTGMCFVFSVKNVPCRMFCLQPTLQHVESVFSAFPSPLAGSWRAARRVANVQKKNNKQQTQLHHNQTVLQYRVARVPRMITLQSAPVGHGRG